MTEYLPYLLIVLLIGLSAFFSGSEIAFSSLSELYVRHLEHEPRNARDRVTVRLSRRWDETLVTILAGNNLVNVGASSVATVIAVHLMGEDGAWVAAAAMTVLILIFGEILPKILAARHAKGAASLASFPLRALQIVFTPFVWCVTKLLSAVSRLWKTQEDPEAVTEDDLETILETAEDEGVVDEDTADLLQSALDFEDVLVWEILTPRVDLFALDLDDPPEKLDAALRAAGHSRIPVYRGSVDNITGILQLDRYLRLKISGSPQPLLRAILPATFIHKTTPISEALKVMQRKSVHMLVVTDEYGGTMGVVTMEDVLEQLVGDIWDETEEVHEEFRALAEGLYEADGDMRLEDFFDELDVKEDALEEEDNATVGGWVIQMLGGYPAMGDSFTFRDLTVTVKKLQRHRVLSVLVRVAPEPGDGEEDD